MNDFATADLFDVHGDRLGVLELSFLDLGGRPRFCGPIRTVKAFEDNSRVREAVSSPGNGAVLVVDAAGSMARAMVGDRLGELAVGNGWAGIVVNGCVRDAKVLRTLDIGIRALGTNPRKTEKRDQGLANVPVEIGGVRIEPDMWLYADEDGILVSTERL